VLTTKMTLLLIMARVFSVKTGFATGIRLFIICMIVFYLILGLLKALVCLPVRAFWDPNVANARCLNQRKVFVADSSFAIITDTAILVLPIIICMPLHLPLLQKIKVMGILSAGGGALGVTIYKTYLLVVYQHSTDYSRDFAKQLFYR
jgi:hypothetical protein